MTPPSTHSPHSPHSLDHILELLNRHRQRATYGAVGGVVDRPPYYVMSGRARNHWHSWFVGKASGQPTKYEPHQIHPELMARDWVITSSAQLEAWLRDPSQRHAT